MTFLITPKLDCSSGLIYFNLRGSNLRNMLSEKRIVSLEFNLMPCDMRRADTIQLETT